MIEFFVTIDTRKRFFFVLSISFLEFLGPITNISRMLRSQLAHSFVIWSLNQPLSEVVTLQSFLFVTTFSFFYKPYYLFYIVYEHLTKSTSRLFDINICCILYQSHTNYHISQQMHRYIGTCTQI